MGARRLESPNYSRSTKSPVTRIKRPEKVAPEKRTNRPLTVGRKSIRRLPKQKPIGALQAAVSSNRIVLLDACNVSHKNLRMPRFAVERLTKALQYFKSANHPVYAIFPKFHLYTGQWDNTNKLMELYKSGNIVVTPCKEFPNAKSQAYDDRILLAIAYAFDCAVVSNDQFRDLAWENENWRWVANNRRIPFEWSTNEEFTIPAQSRGILTGR